MATTLPKIEDLSVAPVTDAPVTDVPRTPDDSFPQAPWMVQRAGNDGPVPTVASTCTECNAMAQMFQDGMEESYEEEEDDAEGQEESFGAREEGMCPLTGEYPCRCSRRRGRKRALWVSIGLLVAAIVFFYMTRNRRR